MIDIFDDTLEHHNAELVDMTIRNLSWKYDYSSTDKGLNKHWHIFCGPVSYTHLTLPTNREV